MREKISFAMRGTPRARRASATPVTCPLRTSSTVGPKPSCDSGSADRAATSAGLAAGLAVGVAGVLAMVPSWWRHRRDARQRAHLQPEPQAPVQAGKGLPTGDASAAGPATLPAELPFPPDMPAPRKPAR